MLISLKKLSIICLLLAATTGCEDRNIGVEGCGGEPPPPFRALIYGENNQNIFIGDNPPDTVYFYTIRDGVKYSEEYEQINVGDSSQLGLYARILSLSYVASSSTYYLEIEGDVDTLQVDVIEEIEASNGCSYLTYGSVQFNGQPATLYPWTRGGGYVLRK